MTKKTQTPIEEAAQEAEEVRAKDHRTIEKTLDNPEKSPKSDAKVRRANPVNGTALHHPKELENHFQHREVAKTL